MNREEFARGKDCQSAALCAFNLSDLDTAYPLYVDAEKHYRAAYPTPSDRVFFMQSSAVRCLEDLIEQRPGLSELYRREADRYLAEWTEDIIKVRISPRRISEALAFRLWIKSNKELRSHIFRDANLAAEADDFEKAKVLLDKVIGDLTESEDPERDAIVAIARSKREMLVAREEIIKHRANRDLRKIAWACLRAAKASHLPAETTSTQTDILSNRRYYALSDALKWRAVKSLKEQALSNDARQKSLEDAERFLRRAASYARTALLKSRGDNLSTTHTRLLTYSHLTVRERLALMRFMITGDDQHFNTAMQAWAGALKIANRLSEIEKEYLFPHHFYSLKDLELEELFLRAAKAFRNAQWRDCVAFLQDWTNSFPIEYRWTWRYSNVMVRLLGVSFIVKICSDSGQLDRATVRQQTRNLSTFVHTEQIGAAGRYFANEIIRLPAKSADDVKNVILQHLCPYFPLDSSVDFYDGPTKINPFDSLPKSIAWGLSLPTSVAESQLKQAKEDFLASVEAILGYICDYDAQWLCPEQALPEPDIMAFLKFCRQFRWAKDSQSEQRLNQLDALVQNIQGVTVADEFITLYEQARQVVRRLLNFVPLVVSIESTPDQTVQQEYVIGSPEWCIDRPERESIRISVKSEAAFSIKPGQYYLPPPWRTGNRLFYLVDPDDNYPLLPVRFSPRCDLPTWVDEKLSRQLFDLRLKGENQHLEFKIDFPRQGHEFAKEIAAFASSGGGLILIGVEDKTCKLIGINGVLNDPTKRQKLIERVEGFLGKITPEVIPSINFALESGKVVLCITVPSGSAPIYYYDGRPYIRDITQSRLATPDEVAERFRAFALKEGRHGTMR